MPTFNLFIPLSALVQDNIYDFIVLRDIFGGLRHKFINDFTENLDISAGVKPDTGNKVVCSGFVLTSAVIESLM